MTVKHIKDCARIRLEHTERITGVPDEVGDLVSRTYLRAFDRIYCLGQVDPGCIYSSIGETFLIVDENRATAFVLNGSGTVLAFGFEDFQWVEVKSYILFYSDGGLIVLNGQSVKWVDFSSLNEYFISIDFSKINDGAVGFDLGYGLHKEYSIPELEGYAVQFSTETNAIFSTAGPLLAYDLSKTGRVR